MPSNGRDPLRENSALTHGLEVLRLLAVSPTPMTSTELAKRLNLHQSTVSRILKTLSGAGYVRKPDYHCFAADYGVLTLGGNANAQFPLTTKPKAAMISLGERCSGLSVSLATLWRGDLIYFIRTQKGHEPIPAVASGYPLHLSSVALRLLIDLPPREALEALEVSKRRHGWDRPTEKVPSTPNASLKMAREIVANDCLILHDFQNTGWLSASIKMEMPGQPAICLAVSGPGNILNTEQIVLMLKLGRDEVIQALQ
jgi:DNA-binding IclR family transcriptional regulator